MYISRGSSEAERVRVTIEDPADDAPPLMVIEGDDGGSVSTKSMHLIEINPCPPRVDGAPPTAMPVM
jgi:hypothetical protein